MRRVCSRLDHASPAHACWQLSRFRQVCTAEVCLVTQSLLACRSRAQERGRATLGALEAKYCKPSPGKRKRGSRPAAAEDAEVAPEADAVDSTPSKPERRKARGKGKAAQ